MTFSRRWIWPLLLTGAMAGGACSSIFAAGELRMTASADDTVASPTRPVAVRVTATNVGDARVTWGPGSSTCKFHLFVRADGTDLFAFAFNGRICTADCGACRRLQSPTLDFRAGELILRALSPHLQSLSCLRERGGA